MQTPHPHERQGSSQDFEDNKVIAALSYILFFLPLLAARNSRFAMYHANQGLLLLLVVIAGNLVLGLIPFIGWILMPIFGFAAIAYLVIGVLNAVNGKMQPLPLMPNIEILK
ncbi:MULTISPECIES: DUF4870 domain-containing protein [Saccharibacillus]|uniref:DUF4870 domain-containing protein n=1 Tax=Saccharibacillus brassicae TaxID=2583377 RepID=A0A4Y6UWN9_SACBS|nr:MULTISPECIES: hypothetical protein [Saccharibacillus]MWJ31998.1 hypothetical protein [Saccharibacillus sp. WB 17]QDH21534.1 hypothetical protein FFV09_12185 [Saccharibacillus brassicae]